MENKFLGASVVPEIKKKINAAVATKQDKLVSGSNIKTINGTSVLGEGDITITEKLYGAYGTNEDGALTQKFASEKLQALEAKDEEIEGRLDDIEEEVEGLDDKFAAKSVEATVAGLQETVEGLGDEYLSIDTKYGASIDMTMDDKTYVVTVTLKDQAGATLGEAKTIDLPLESVVVSGRYDDATKKVILTLKDGSEVDFSVADLVKGLQSELSADNQLSADFVKDGSTNKVFTATEKTKLTGIEEGAQKNVKADWDAESGDAQILNKPTIPTDTNDLTNGAGFITNAALATYATKSEVEAKQDKLTSGTTIKTVNGNSLLGAGNVQIDVPTEMTAEEFEQAWSA